MYTVYCDDILIHDGSSPSREVKLLSPNLKLGDNTSGSFTALIPVYNTGYDIVERFVSTIVIKQDGNIIWKGRVVSESRDIWNNRNITCEGALSFLNDSIQDLGYYEGRDLSYFIGILLDAHNIKTSSDRHILFGTINVVDDNTDYIYQTSYKNTYEEMKDNFLERLGGHLSIRYRQADGMPILDYISDYTNIASQEINFGVNLLDFTRNWDVSDLCTVILPRGKSLDEENEHGQKDYVNISSVNSGSKFLQSQSAVETYGRIERVVDFDDCETPALLYQLASDYLTSFQFDVMVIELNAVDLHYLDSTIESFSVLDNVHCVSSPHGMDRYFPITEIEIPLDTPENVKYKLGGYSSKSITGSVNSKLSNVDKVIRTITPTNTIVNLAKKEMTTMLVDYAHITNGIIDNAIIEQAKVKDLYTTYAHISEGIIDNAKISYADVNQLNTHYAHIANGIIDNAFIDSARVNNLDTEYAHITNGYIDNAKIGSAKIDDLDNRFAHIEEGVIENATIDQAKVNDLSTNYAKIVDGVIDTATINYANVNGLNTHYALIDMSNTSNAWIDNGVIKDGVITNAMIISVSANKLTAGSIDASTIRVYNLNADNITAGTLNGQRIGNRTVALNKLSQTVYTQNEIDNIVETLEGRIDSAIETWTGTAVPTLINVPASNWTTNDEKDVHIGDVYYVVNENLPENGYSYRFSSINGTYSWELIRDTDVTDALQRLNTLEGKVVVIEQFDSDISTWKTNTDSEISSVKNNHTALVASVNKTVKSVVQLWYTKQSSATPAKPSAHVSSTNDISNAWTLAVPTYDSNNPNYFYCYEYLFVDGTYGWSNVVLDKAMTDAQRDANSGIESSVQLWTISDTQALPQGPSVINVEYVLDSSGNTVIDSIQDPYSTSFRWTIEVPTYDFGRPNYFYCWQYHHVDGSVSWSDVVFDKATTEAQKRAANLEEQLDYSVDVITFNEVKQTTDENSARITRLSTVVDNNSTTTSQSINELTQTANSTNSKIRNITTRLGLSSDGTAGTNDILEQHSELEQTFNGFVTTVESTYSTKQEVDDIVIGGRNLLRLTREFVGTYLIDEEGYSIFDSDDLNIASSKANNGYLNVAFSQLLFTRYENMAVRYLDMSSYSASVYKQFVRFDDVILSSNGSYILSFYAKGSGRIYGYFYPKVSSQSMSNSTSQGVQGTNDYGRIYVELSSEWTRVWIKWSLTGTGSKSYRDVELRLYGGNIAYVCGMKFETGTKVTAWTPAPEDGEENSEEYVQKTIGGVLERVSQAETQIIQNEKYIGLKADQADTYTITQVDGIITKEVSNRTSAIELSANQILSTVEDTYTTKTSYNGLENRVVRNTSIINQHGYLIELKANSSDVYTKTDTNGLINTEVSNRNAAILAAVDGINLNVSNTYTTKEEFAGLDIGGLNLLRMTESFDDTYISDSNSVAILDSDRHSLGETIDCYMTFGQSVLTSETYHSLAIRYLSSTELDSSSFKEFARYTRVVIPDTGSSYALSFYAKGSGTLNTFFYPNSSGGTCSAKTSQGETNSNTNGNIWVSLSDSWTRYWIVWTIGGTQSTSYRNVLLRLYGGSEVYVAGVKFEQGNVATSWSPSPYDSGVDFDKELDDLRNEIVSSKAEFNITADNINSVVSKKTDSGSIISTINQSAESVLISAEKVNIAGAAIFENYTRKSEVINNINYVYISKRANTTSVTPPSSWITNNTGNQNTWTTKRPIYNSSFPVLFVAQQSELIDGTYSCTVPVKDDTTTVIDGGNIITNSIDANKINTSSIFVSDLGDGGYLRNNAITNSQYIYKSMSSGTTSLDSPEEWISDVTGNQNRWTTKRPIYNSSFPVLFVAHQERSISQIVTTSTPEIDNTTTVIDGGRITTGIIDASRVNVTNLNASNIVGGIIKSKDESTYINLDTGQIKINSTALYGNGTLEDALNSAQQYVETYMRYENGELILGKIGSEIQNVMKSNKQIYRTSAGDIAYYGLDDARNIWKLFIDNAQINDTLQFGDFAWIARANGNMTIKWIGD